MAGADQGPQVINDDNDSLTNSLEEWTVIGEQESHDDIHEENSEKHITDDKDGCSPIEDAREALQILEESNYQEAEIQIENKIRSDDIRDDDSDGVSVITESEKGEDTLCTSISKIIVPIHEIPPVGAFFHIIVACSLAAAVGFGIGFLIGDGKTQFSTNQAYFENTEAMQSFNYPNDINEKTSLTGTEVPAGEKSKSSGIQTESIVEETLKRPKNIDNLNDNINSFKNIIEIVKSSLDILCSLIENDRKSRTTKKYFICDKGYSIIDLINLKDNLENVITKTQVTQDRFIENINSKIMNVSLIFFEDVSKTVKMSLVKFDRKLNKVRRKLEDRICLIRNTITDDPRVLEILSNQNMLRENCTTEKLKNVQQNFQTQNSEFQRKKFKKSLGNHIRPKVQREMDSQKSNIKSKDQKEERKSVKDKKEMKLMKKGPEKKFLKEEFVPTKESIDLNTANEHKIHPTLPSIKNQKNSNEKSEKVCHEKSCAKLWDNHKKITKGITNENWQFKRSEGRQNLRTTDEISEPTWEYTRAKARETARKKY